jgi:hypothetical protein
MYANSNNRNRAAASEAANANAQSNAANLSEIQRTRIIPKMAEQPPYQATWNSHVSSSSNFNMSDVDAIAEKLADKFVQQGFVQAESSPTEKNTDYKQGLATLLAVQKARVPMQAKEIGEILKDNGITIEDGESYDFHVDKFNKITVSGSDADKAQRIEDVLNGTDQLGWKLNRLSNLYSPRYDVKEGEEYDRANFHEMQAESNIKELSDGKLSMKDLWLEDGKIMGLPPELDELLNLTKPDMTDHETTIYSKMNAIMKSVLERGLDNIPDLYTEARYQNGKLMFF